MEGLLEVYEYLNAKNDPRLKIVNACIVQGDYRRAHTILDHLIECVYSKEKPENDLALLHHAYARCSPNEVDSKMRITNLFYLN